MVGEGASSGGGWPIAQGGARPNPIVVLAPSADDDLSLLETGEDLQLQALVSELLGDASLLAGERQALALRYEHLDLAQHHYNLLGADLSTSGHPGLLWFQLILSIRPVQSEPVTSEWRDTLGPQGDEFSSPRRGITHAAASTVSCLRVQPERAG